MTARLTAARIFRSGVVYASLGLAMIVVLIPFYWEVSTSLKDEVQMFARPPIVFPWPLTLGHYAHAFERGVGGGLVNSLVVSIAAAACTLVIGSAAAYSLARLKFPGANLVLFLIVVPMMIPGLSNVVPVYIIMSRLGLLDTRFVLILLYTITNLPLVVWILRGFFQAIPREIEEAASIDGCSPVQSLYRVVLPLSQPALATAALFVFIHSWNDFVLAVTMTSSEHLRTAQVWLWSTISDVGTDWGALMAVSNLANLPAIAVFLVLQRRFIAGLTAGALRG